MSLLQTFLARAALPFKLKRPLVNLGERRPSMSTSHGHDDWLFEDERPVVGKTDVFSRLTASLCRLRNCLVDIANAAPIIEVRPSHYRVEFSDHCGLEDDVMFDDELFDRPTACRPERSEPTWLDNILFDRSAGLAPA